MFTVINSLKNLLKLSESAKVPEKADCPDKFGPYYSPSLDSWVSFKLKDDISGYDITSEKINKNNRELVGTPVAVEKETIRNGIAVWHIEPDQTGKQGHFYWINDQGQLARSADIYGTFDVWTDIIQVNVPGESVWEKKSGKGLLPEHLDARVSEITVSPTNLPNQREKFKDFDKYQQELNGLITNFNNEKDKLAEQIPNLEIEYAALDLMQANYADLIQAFLTDKIKPAKNKLAPIANFLNEFKEDYVANYEGFDEVSKSLLDDQMQKLNELHQRVLELQQRLDKFSEQLQPDAVKDIQSYLEAIVKYQEFIKASGLDISHFKEKYSDLTLTQLKLKAIDKFNAEKEILSTKKYLGPNGEQTRKEAVEAINKQISELAAVQNDAKLIAEQKARYQKLQNELENERDTIANHISRIDSMKAATKTRGFFVPAAHVEPAYHVETKANNTTYATGTISPKHEQEYGRTQIFNNDGKYIATLQFDENVEANFLSEKDIELMRNGGIQCMTTSGWPFVLREDNQHPKASLPGTSIVKVIGESDADFNKRLMAAMAEMILTICANWKSKKLKVDSQNPILTVAGVVYLSKLQKEGFDHIKTIEPPIAEVEKNHPDLFRLANQYFATEYAAKEPHLLETVLAIQVATCII